VWSGLGLDDVAVSSAGRALCWSGSRGSLAKGGSKSLAYVRKGAGAPYGTVNDSSDDMMAGNGVRDGLTFRLGELKGTSLCIRASKGTMLGVGAPDGTMIGVGASIGMVMGLGAWGAQGHIIRYWSQ
jgi:hypothetical protein